MSEITEYSEINDVKYINRELSWLEFNQRVLEEANNSNHPLLERLNFLSISARNLDEFYSVRVAGLVNQIKHKSEHKSIDSLSPKKQLKNIIEKSNILIENQQLCWKQLRNSLEQNHINILSTEKYNKQDKKFLDVFFKKNIFPILSPILVDSSHDFPHLLNLSLAIIVQLEDNKESNFAVIRIPQNIKRFIKIQNQISEKKSRFAILEDVIINNLPSLFPDRKIISSIIVRDIRDSDLNISDKADDLIKSFESAIKKRLRGNVIDLKIFGNFTDELSNFIKSNVDVNLDSLGIYDIQSGNDFLGLSEIYEIYKIDRPDLKFKQYISRFPERINDFHGDCFAAIKSKDILIHHPYESFDVVVQFLKQAAKDPDVIAIKQTLYRTSSDSPIVKALLDAAIAGKEVTVIVELKARFDEKANLDWGKHLKKAGAQVIFSVKNLKVHSKMSLVIRKEGNKTRPYLHIGTGNYHPENAQIYSDLSFFTSDKDICRDSSLIFNFLVDNKEPKDLKLLYISPFTLQDKILDLIQKEIDFVKEGKIGNIWMKANALIDKKIIDKLYYASSAGVKIELVIRGNCCLKPGVPGLSENISVKSIVGRFLEHTRIFCFGNGGSLPSNNAKVYISSADLMPRNMNRRVELMVPIKNDTVHKQILNKIMMANLVDRKQSWIMQPDGSYSRSKTDVDDKYSKLSAHEYFMKNPSLSGRGTALYGDSQMYNIPIASESSKKIAVIDIGSNSVRLVIYDSLSRTPLPLFNEKKLCGLAKGMSENGYLNEDGINMAIRSLERFMYIIRSMKVGRIFCFATSAVRDAIDGNDFVKKIEQKCHLNIQVLSGEEEAMYASLGVVSSFFKVDGIVGDMGGGSLELAYTSFLSNEMETFFGQDIILDNASFPIGSLRLLNTSNNNLKVAKKIFHTYIDNFNIEKFLKNKTFYAVGGGFRTLAKIHIELNKHPIKVIHNYTIEAADLLKTLKHIEPMDLEEIDRLFDIPSNRVETIKITALVMHELIKKGKPKYISFSTHGVREGILFDKLSSDKKGKDALITACSRMILHISPDSNNQWLDFGNNLFKWTNGIFLDETEYMTRLRKASCIMHNISWYEHSAYKAETSFRWILDSELPAIDHWERAFIAMSTYHRYQTRKNPYIMDKVYGTLSDKWIKRARSLGLAMRLGYKISGGSSQLLGKTSLVVKKNKIQLGCSYYDDVVINMEIINYFEKLASSMKLKPEIIKQ